jgi:hypothetical protein
MNEQSYAPILCYIFHISVATNVIDIEVSSLATTSA